MELKIKRYGKDENEFPQILNQYERMPEELYLLGDFPDPKKRSVAIVGARSCSEYGRSEAVRFARILAENGVQIISGMALGIDSALSLPFLCFSFLTFFCFTGFSFGSVSTLRLANAIAR